MFFYFLRYFLIIFFFVFVRHELIITLFSYTQIIDIQQFVYRLTFLSIERTIVENKFFHLRIKETTRYLTTRSLYYKLEFLRFNKSIT